MQAMVVEEEEEIINHQSSIINHQPSLQLQPLFLLNCELGLYEVVTADVPSPYSLQSIHLVGHRQDITVVTIKIKSKSNQNQIESNQICPV